MLVGSGVEIISIGLVRYADYGNGFEERTKQLECIVNLCIFLFHSNVDPILTEIILMSTSCKLCNQVDLKLAIRGRSWSLLR